MKIVIALALIAGLVFQLWVTYRVVRTDLYERTQKSAQAKLIWLLPVLGATIVLSVLSEEEKAQRPPPAQRG
jgi:tellurite resistance protein TehA-like permease